MPTRAITLREAMDLIGAWGDRRLRPLCTPSTTRADPALEETCSAMLLWLADDPEADLADVPVPLLLVAWERVLIWAGIAAVQGDLVIAEVPAELTPDELLQAAIGGFLAKRVAPQELRAPISQAKPQPTVAGPRRAQ